MEQDMVVINSTQSNNIFYVDFNHTELCKSCNPVSCLVAGEKIAVGTWRDLIVTLAEKYLAENNSKMLELCALPLFPGSSRPFLLAEKPNGAARQLTNGYWIYINYNIPALVDLIGKLIVHCGINLEEVEITYTFKKNRRFINSIDNLNAELQNEKPNVETIIPQKVLIILSEKYNLGFKFETTMIRLLSDETGINIDHPLQTMLKSLMFCRKDNVYFLIDSVVNAEIRRNIISTADAWVNQYGCFECSELYKLFLDEINSNCIGDTKDFEDFFRKIYKKDIYYVSRYGTQFVSTRKNISDLLENIIKKIASEIYDDYDGVINEDELKCRFTGFSIEVLSKMINQYAKTLFKMEINGITCYQTFDTLGLPDDFSMLLSDAFSQISELGLEPTLDVLNTVLSIQMGVNFRNKYSITDNQMFRRLISMYYKPEPQREWKGSIFVEVLK